MGFLPYTDAEMQRERCEEEAMVKSSRNKKRDELAQCHLGHLLIQHSIDSGLTSAQSWKGPSLNANVSLHCKNKSKKEKEK